MANYQIHQGNNVDTLKQYEDNHFDAIITDPPYGIEFLGKDWDNNTGAVETWEQCFRVLKPGGHLLAFSAARTYHHLASNIEQVGFVIRDQLMWLYASGFPKAQDIGKAIQKRQGVKETKPLTANGSPNGIARMTYSQSEPKKLKETENATDIVITSPEAQQWAGWKTALKPAHEPIVMARKPFKGSCIDNVLTHGVGALNIDATRIPFEDKGKEKLEKWANKWDSGKSKTEGFDVYGNSKHEVSEQGRFPNNVMGEVTGYQKFFYCPKVSRKERHCGFEQDQVVGEQQMIEHMGGYYINKQREEQSQTGKDIWLPHKGHIQVHGLKEVYAEWLKTQNTIDTESAPLAHIPSTTGGMWDTDGSGTQYNRASIDKKPSMNKNQDPLSHIPTDPSGMNDKPEGTYAGHNHTQRKPAVGNNHPTVKPVALMRYLIQLVTPPNSVVLDPFCGSGSTGMAACELGHQFVGCELDPNYVTITTKRIEGWLKPDQGTLKHINTYDRRQDGLKSAGIQGIQQLKERRDNRPNPMDLFEDTE